MQRFLMIYNPIAGSLNKKLIDDVERRLKSAGKNVQVYPTRSAGDATIFLQSKQWQADVVIAIGGDGSCNEVINGLKDQDTILAVIPQGTANVLAKELKLPNTASKISAMLLAEKTQAAFIMNFNQRRFLLMAGIGYDAKVVANTHMGIKKRWGKFAYVLSIFQQIKKYGQDRYEYRVDDGPWKSAYSLIISNSRCYGGAFVISRTLTISDDFFKVFAFEKASRLSLIKYLLSLPLGLFESTSGITSIKAKKVEVRGKSCDLVQIDGDIAGNLNGIFSMEKKPISIIVP